MEKSIKRQVVNAAEAVKRKVRKMRNIETDRDKTLENVFKPIINPLNQMLATKKQSTQSKKNKVKKIKSLRDSYSDASSSSEPYLDKTIMKRKSDIINNEKDLSDVNTDEDDNDNNNSFNDHDISNMSFKTVDSAQNSPARNASSWSLSSEFYEDVPYGVRNERGKLMMGSARVTTNGEYITIGGHTYDNTVGIRELIFKKVPDTNLITSEDIQNYKTMLMDTNAHRRDFDSTKPIKSNKGRKYLNIIKPLFKLRKVSVSTDGSVAQGSGLPSMKKWNKDVDYVYWDDPNELVERLKILIASRDAGNTGLDNEIISVLEELRESGIIV